jgi:malonyl-CoA/methylmalonyl-CoA synthetase
MLTHRNLASNALALVSTWGFTRGDVLLHALPVYHVHGLFVAIHCALLSGSRMLWLPKFDAREVIALLPKATVMMGVPTFYTRLSPSRRSGARRATACGCSCRDRRRCCPRRSTSSSGAPASASSSATA